MKYSDKTGAGLAMVVLCVLVGVQTTEAVYWMEILKVAEMAFSNINHAWYLLEPKLKPDQPMFYVKSEEETLLARINEINRKISNIQEAMRIHEENIVRKLQLIPREIMTEMKVNQVLDLIRDIETRYETFTNYVELGIEDPSDEKPKLDRLTMENFALFTVSPSSDSPLSVLSKLHNLLIPHMDSDRLLGTKSFYYTFKDYLLSLQSETELEYRYSTWLRQQHPGLHLFKSNAIFNYHPRAFQSSEYITIWFSEQQNFNGGGKLLK